MYPPVTMYPDCNTPIQKQGIEHLMFILKCIKLLYYTLQIREKYHKGYTKMFEFAVPKFIYFLKNNFRTKTTKNI